MKIINTKDAIDYIVCLKKVLGSELNDLQFTKYKIACNMLYPIAIRNKPMEVKLIRKKEFYFCPRCGQQNIMGYGLYCPGCGQLVSFKNLSLGGHIK